MTGDILADIAAYKRDEVRERRRRTSTAELEAAAKATSAPRGFRAALVKARTPSRPALIAEIKKASPSKGVIRADFDPADHARSYATGGAACLSVLTDGPSFQGSDNDLVAARAACALPVLRKEFLVDPWQVAESRALGADAVLVILAMVDDSLAETLLSEAARLYMDVLVETHDETEIDRAIKLGAALIGINNRDLRTFITDVAVTERLREKIPATSIMVTESGINTPADVARVSRAGAGAMLVGESLMRQRDVAAATRVLLGDLLPST